MSDSDSDGETSDEENGDLDRTVDRTFVCNLCGFATTQEASLLQAENRGVCLNCGDWTVQPADGAELAEAAREVAAALSGEILTEQQVLAYILREVLDVDRQVAAEEMDSSASNVDNLHRRGAEKVAAARELLDGLDAVQPAEGDQSSA